MNIKKTISLRLLALAIAGTTVLSSCDSNEQNFSEELEVANSSQSSSLESLLPPGTSSKVLNSKSDITGSGPIYLIQGKGAETASLVELCQEQGVDYLVKASNKVEKEALKNSMVAFLADVNNSSDLYVLTSKDSEEGYQTFIYQEGKSSFSNSDESYSVTLGDITDQLQQDMSKLQMKKKLRTSDKTNKDENKGGLSDYQFQVTSYLQDINFKYAVVFKVAKGRTSDTEEVGYGIHLDYFPIDGITHPEAKFGSKTYNSQYNFLYPSRGHKYFQKLSNLITGLTFNTKLIGATNTAAKDYYPDAKIGTTVTLTRSEPNYSFTIGGGLDASVGADGPSLGANLNGSYTYSSGSQSAAWTQSDVNNRVINEENRIGTREVGLQYIQALIAGKEYLYKHPRQPDLKKVVRIEDPSIETLIQGGLNKTLSPATPITDDNFYHVTPTTMPTLSRSHTKPKAMVNFFIPENGVPENGEVQVRHSIVLDILDVFAWQTPYEVFRAGSSKIVAGDFNSQYDSKTVTINLNKLKNKKVN
ncbi:hypothetical protein [Tenacibaculum sp. C7A-26P2]|uniref:hypothetical protein n=1 Tax=Tenacibaculum sp. C7A-26P2 TaxID=3447504 RepID=UPI003F836725